MRLDARSGARGWTTWHVPSCRHVRHVVSVDTERLEVETYVLPYRMEAGRLLTTIQRFERIVVLEPPKVILLDPVDDEQLEAALAAADDTNWG